MPDIMLLANRYIQGDQKVSASDDYITESYKYCSKCPTPGSGGH